MPYFSIKMWVLIRIALMRRGDSTEHPQHTILLRTVENYPLIELRHDKTSFMLYANNKDADQPAHPHSLISVFIVRCLDSTRSVLDLSKISRL